MSKICDGPRSPNEEACELMLSAKVSADSFWGSRQPMREVLAAASTGSVSGLILTAFVQALQAPSLGPVGQVNLGHGIEPYCPLPPANLDFGEFSERVFLLGVFCGLALGPVIDILYGLRLW